MQYKPDQPSLFEFSREQIRDAVQHNRLLSMEIELSLQCNFKCPYCYVSSNNISNNELSVEEIRDVIMQARDLGIKRIIILGGEPMIYAHIFSIISFIRTLDIEVEMFTNGINIDANSAKKLFDFGVHVVLKMNSFNENIQDELTGVEGSFKIINNAFCALKKVGYPSDKAYLAVSTIICRQNIDEIVPLWQWLRDQHIIPYFETITPQGNAEKNTGLYVDPIKTQEIFSALADIDREKYGYVWEPQPPLVGTTCMRHQYSCMVTSCGEIMPCVGVTIPLGNIRTKKLGDILSESVILNDFKNYRNTIKGPCRNCEKAYMCYGCRGAAYQLTGDCFASDPTCWKNKNNQKEIISLPVSVNSIIPQKSSMRVIDTLTSTGEKVGTVTVVVTNEMIFVDKDGFLDEVVYMEMIAQAIASLEGFRHMGIADAPPQGFLLGAKKFKIIKKAKIGDVLNISVREEAQFSNFHIIRGSVYRNSALLAEGEIKVFKSTLENIEVYQEDKNQPTALF